MTHLQKKSRSHYIGLIGHFRVQTSLYFKASQCAKSFLGIPVFIHIEIRTYYHNKHFTPRLALKERLRGTRRWSTGQPVDSGYAWMSSWPRAVLASSTSWLVLGGGLSPSFKFSCSQVVSPLIAVTETLFLRTATYVNAFWRMFLSASINLLHSFWWREIPSVLRNLGSSWKGREEKEWKKEKYGKRKVKTLNTTIFLYTQSLLITS